MFDRFTKSGEQAVVLAREEARRLGHDYLGTEHLLIGVLRAKEGLGAEILTGAGLTLDESRAKIAEMVGYPAGDEGRAAPRGRARSMCSCWRGKSPLTERSRL